MIYIKRVLSLSLIFLMLNNLILPYKIFAAAPEEPPEMPDWWKEKYGDMEIENEEFKNKEIKTIKPPKKVTNPTPIGIGFGLVSEYLFSQSDYYKEMEQSFWDKVNELDQSAYEFLAERGIEGWGDVFEIVSNNYVKFTDTFINAVNSFFNDYDTSYYIDYNKHLNTIEPGLFTYINSNFDGSIDEYGGFKNLVSIESVVYEDSTKFSKSSMNVFFIYHSYSGTHHSLYSSRYFIYDSSYDDFIYGKFQGFGASYSIGRQFDIEKFNKGIKELREDVKERIRINFDENKITRSEFLNNAKKSHKDLSIKNHGYVPNPFGSRLTNPNDVNDLSDYEYGKIEIDGDDYHIINVPNPNHTPELEPSHPDYVPDYYPIIKPVIPIPNKPDDPESPVNPNKPPLPEIPLLPDITPNIPEPNPNPDPSPNPNPDPNPNPNPDPNPNPNPDPSPNPNPVPSAPDSEFGEGKGCRELDLDLKSIDLFTTKFPFSIPWDIYRALEAFFGKMGNEEPRFVLTFISEETVLELPEFIKEWIPLVRSLILLIFDVSIIYALYRWFGGAS